MLNAEFAMVPYKLGLLEAVLSMIQPFRWVRFLDTSRIVGVDPTLAHTEAQFRVVNNEGTAVKFGVFFDRMKVS